MPGENEKKSPAENDDDCPFVDSPRQISAAPAAAAVVDPYEDDNEGSDDQFEFEFVIRNQQAVPSITADEIFSNGQIRPIFPVLSRDHLAGIGDEGSENGVRHSLLYLLLEDRESPRDPSFPISSSSSRSAEDPEVIPPGNHWIWKITRSTAQSQGLVRKSSSTGSSNRWRIRDLVIGRSRSDGKEKFVFLPEDDKTPSEKAGIRDSPAPAKGKKGKRTTDGDFRKIYRVYHGRSEMGMPGKERSGSRKSFLPYKPDILGFFTNTNGLSRVHNPF